MRLWSRKGKEGVAAAGVLPHIHEAACVSQRIQGASPFLPKKCAIPLFVSKQDSKWKNDKAFGRAVGGDLWLARSIGGRVVIYCRSITVFLQATTKEEEEESKLPPPIPPSLSLCVSCLRKSPTGGSVLVAVVVFRSRMRRGINIRFGDNRGGKRFVSSPVTLLGEGTNTSPLLPELKSFES